MWEEVKLEQSCEGSVVRAGENIPERGRWEPQEQFRAGTGIYVDSTSTGSGDSDWIVECVGAVGYRGDDKAGLKEWGGVIAAPKPGWWLGLDSGLVT